MRVVWGDQDLLAWPARNRGVRRSYGEYEISSNVRTCIRRGFGYCVQPSPVTGIEPTRLEAWNETQSESPRVAQP